MPAHSANNPMGFHRSYRQVSFEFSSSLLLRLFTGLFALSFLPRAFASETAAPSTLIPNPFPFYLNDTYFEFSSKDNLGVWPVFVSVVKALKTGIVGNVTQVASDPNITTGDVWQIDTCNGAFKLVANVNASEIATEICNFNNLVRNNSDYITLAQKCAFVAKYGIPIVVVLCVLAVIGTGFLFLVACWTKCEVSDNEVVSSPSIEGRSNYDAINDRVGDQEMTRIGQP